MATVDGATLLARSLRQQGIDHMFGIVGFPVIPLAIAFQREGGKFYGMRNEQAASYAAGAVGYLTGRPGVCLAVSGPGMIHGIAGMANAWANGWPMMLIGGANPTYQNGRGAFQEAPQIEAARPFAKYCARPESPRRIPFFVEQAVRYAMYGRPGAVYLDMPDDIITGTVEESEVHFPPRCPDPPRLLAPEENVRAAIDLLKSAERPLVIVGKGMAYARAEDEVREFIERTRLPYLPTPMGKGVIPDDHPNSVAPARSFALQNADVIFLMGARLNWILHFGLPPRFSPNVRTIQLDIEPEEIGNNVPCTVPLVGDGKAVVGQLNRVLAEEPWEYPAETTWWTGLRQKAAENQQMVDQMEHDDSVPMGYYRVLREIRELLPKDAIVASEGANTMDISRTVIPNYFPRHRLDAGTFGTMGVGLAQAIAAQVVHPDKKVVAIEGDSAFGFSGMEVEVMARYRLPITVIIINNNGISGGPTKLDPDRVPPNAYLPNAHYEKMAEAFGGKGFFVTRPEELRPALREALESDTFSIVNIMIDPRAGRKPQQFGWLTR